MTVMLSNDPSPLTLVMDYACKNCLKLPLLSRYYLDKECLPQDPLFKQELKIMC